MTPQRRVRHGIGAAALGLLLAGTACDGRRDGGVDSGRLLSRTLEIVADVRPVRPRLTGARTHAACPPSEREGPPSMRCGAVDREALARVVRIAAELRRRREGEIDDAASARVASLLGLFTADAARSVNQSVERLNAALERHGRTPELLNDLAALLLVRAEVLDAPADAVAALRHADEALSLRSPFPEATANRAHALEASTLWSAAARAWRRAEREAEDDGWRLEAAAGRRRCESRARDGIARREGRHQPSGLPSARWVTENPYPARLFVEEQLARWARLGAAGRDREAESALESAARVADLLARRTGDRLYLEATRRIQAAAGGPAADLRALRRGHLAFDLARGGGIYSDCSGPALASADAAFGGTESPFRGWVLLDRAICGYFTKDFHSAEARLAEIEELTGRGAYPTLAGRRAWILALIRMVQGRYDEAIAAYRDAIADFERVGEREHVTYLHSLLAKTYRYLGADEAAWRLRMTALAGRGEITSAARAFTILEEVVEALRAEGAGPELLYFLAEQLAAVEAPRRAGDWDLVVYTLLDRREALLALGRVEEADADLAKAERAWARLPPGDESRERLRLELDLQHAAAAADDAGQLAAIERSLAFFQRHEGVAGDRIQVLALHRAAAGVHLRHGRLGPAERALLASLAEAEAQREGLMSPEHRASFLDEMREVSDRLVGIQLDGRGDPWRALELVERFSNRVLLDSIDASSRRANEGRAAAWRKVTEVPVPRGSAIVRYGRLGDRLLVWTFAPSGRWFEERDVPRRYLDERLASFAALLHDRRARPLLEDLLAELGGRLLPEAVRDLPAGTHLVFVTDDSTAGVPFAALRDGAGGAYLGQRFPISTAPSLLVHRRTRERGGSWRTPLDRGLLVVADPAFDRDLFPRLTALPAARAAGERLRALHPGATLLAGDAATEASLTAAFPGPHLFHFEGHAVTDPANGARNALVLAPGDPAHPDRESSLLRAEELSRLDLGSVRLIVLGACSTAVGLYPESREVASLATSFLAAGAPAVVASLWDVEDTAAAALLEELHRRLAAGSPPAVALQQAQAALRARGDRLAHPAAWAGFEVFGHGG